MNINDIAASLEGREYTKETKPGEEKEWAKHGIVVAFGASDDLMEFRGAVSDDVGAYDGGTAYFTSAGLYKARCQDEDCPHEQEIRDRCATIEARLDGHWQFKTVIPHGTFNVMEDGELFGQGIVFRLEDVNVK